jgi:putative flippase GtrA
MAQTKKRRPGRAASNARRKEARKQKKRLLEIRRIGEYLVSGGLYFWTGYAVFFVADSLLGWSLWWAKLLANVTGWTVNYLLQRYWVFRNPQLAKHQVEVTGRYLFITAVNFVLDYLIVYGLQQFGITPYIGQFISAGFFTVWNYVWYKTWVFTNHFRKHRRHA